MTTDDAGPRKSMNAMMTGVCVIFLIVLLPTAVVADFAIRIFRRMSEDLGSLAGKIERGADWVLDNGPRLDRHDRI